MKAIILIVIIAVGLGLTVRARMARIANETAMARIPVERDALARDVARERRRAQVARDARAAMPASSAAEAVESAASKSRKLSPEAALANNPPLMAENLRYRHDVPDWWFGGMFRALGLSAEQIEQWKQMLVQAEQRRFDLIAAVETQGLDRNSATFKALNADIAKFRRDREAEILGDLEPKYREYRRLDDTRVMAQWLTRTAIYSDEPPPTGEQVERATQILAANTRQILRGPEGEAIPVVDWTATNAQLKDVLSASQIATLQVVGKQFEKIAAVSQQLNERTKELTAQFKAQPPAK